jgi:hypothetical protein
MSSTHLNVGEETSRRVPGQFLPRGKLRANSSELTGSNLAAYAVAMRRRLSRNKQRDLGRSHPHRGNGRFFAF